MKTFREYIDMLDEISRRGFLKGAGAAAGLAATGAVAAPFRHGGYVDQMTGQGKGNYSVVKSDNSNASLTIQWPGKTEFPGAVIQIPGAIVSYEVKSKVWQAQGRIKIGNEPVESVTFFRPDSGKWDTAMLSFDYGEFTKASDIARKILKHSGKVKIEVPLYKQGPTVFDFTIEQDKITQQYQKDDSIAQEKSRAEKEKARIEKEKLDQEVEIMRDKWREQEQEKQKSDLEGIKSSFRKRRFAEIGRSYYQATRKWPDWYTEFDRTDQVPDWYIEYEKTGKWPPNIYHPLFNSRGQRNIEESEPEDPIAKIDKLFRDN